MEAPAPTRLSVTDTQARLTLAATGFLLGAVMAAIRVRFGPADFDVFWWAGRHWFAPYDPASEAALKAALHLRGAWPFAYPPTFLLLARPFALLPMGVAYSLWAGLSLAVFTWTASFVIRPRWGAALMFITPPIVFAVAPGQSTLFVGSALIGGTLLLDRRPLLAGVLLAAAACIKPQAALLAPIILIGRWRTMGAAIAAGLSLMAASLVFGPERWVEWFGALRSFQGVLTMTQRVNPSALMASPAWSVAMAAFGVWLAWTSRNLLGLVGGTLCCTPYAQIYDLAPLAPLSASWLLGRRDAGWGRFAAGGAFLAGLVQAPATLLAFLAAAAVTRGRWAPLVRLRLVPAPGAAET